MNSEKNRRVLVIDDNAAIHDDFRKVIGAREASGEKIDQAAAELFNDRARLDINYVGFEIDSAYQGQEGLACVQRAVQDGRPYCVAFVDVRMPPGWDGVETVKRIWDVDPDVQIVICTAYSDYSWNDMVQVLGESDALLILKKPFDNVEVRQLASALCEKWRLTRQARGTVDDLQAMVNQRTSRLLRVNEQLQSEIADRRRSEEALRESDARKAAIVSSAMDCIVAIDEMGRITEFNPAAESTFGYAASEAIGKPIAELIIPPELRATYHQCFEHFLAAGEFRLLGKRFESLGLRADGQQFPLELSLVRTFQDGVPTIIGFFRDLTDRQQVEARLAPLQKLEASVPLVAGIAD